MKAVSKNSQLTGRCEGDAACSAETAAGETRIKEANVQGFAGCPEPDDEVPNQSSLVHRGKPQAAMPLVCGMHPSS